MPKDKALMELMESPAVWLPETADLFSPETRKESSPPRAKPKKP
jgi:hypothetical protein